MSYKIRKQTSIAITENCNGASIVMSVFSIDVNIIIIVKIKSMVSDCYTFLTSTKSCEIFFLELKVNEAQTQIII
jgi:hypothetical protein